MSTQAQLSPLEQLGQDVGNQAPPKQQSTSPQQNLSPLEQLGQDVQKTPPPSQPVRHTVRAMQQTMGGPPMFVDVPEGTKDQFEKAGQEGYQKGGQIGAGIVAGGAGLAAAAEPIIAAASTTAIPGFVQKAKDIAEWAKSNPIKSVAIAKIADEMGIHPFDLMHSVVKYGKNLFGGDEK